VFDLFHESEGHFQKFWKVLESDRFFSTAGKNRARKNRALPAVGRLK
jgi:hypothetical protein